MRFDPPIQAKVNTRRFTHSDWKNGETVWIFDVEQGCCKIAHDHEKRKPKEPEGSLRLEALEVTDEDGRLELREAVQEEKARIRAN